MDTGYVGKTCPYCQYAITEDVEVYVCPECQSPHHRECWVENGGCTTFGCRYAPIVGPIAQPRMNYARVQSRAIAPAGIYGGVICPYCGQTTTNSMTDCEHCHRPLYAGFWNRLWAYMFDKVVLTIANYLLMIILMIPALIIIGFSAKSSDPSDFAVGLAILIVAVLGPVIFNWLYYAFCESSSWRGTPGKMIMGLVVTDSEGRKISFWRASARYFLSWLSMLMLFTGYFAAAFTPKKQALHDIITNTLVARSIHPDAQGNDENAVRRKVMGILMGILLFIFILMPLAFWLSFGNSSYYNLKASEYYDAEKYDQAIEYYSKAIDAGAATPDAYQKRGYCYEELGKYQEAIDDYSQALKENDSDPDLYLNRGDCYREIQEYRSALVDYTDYIEGAQKPSSYDTDDKHFVELGYCRRAQVYVDLGQNDQALENLKLALEIDPQYYDALCTRGDLYMDLGQMQLAIADYSSCIEVEPEDTYAYKNRARAYLRLNNSTAALSDINYALEIDPEDADSFVVRAACNTAVNNIKAARADYLKALAMDPKNEEAKQGLARLIGK
ncbi:MAG: tetratricopeptide repeat protein [Acidobacteriota bacterium]